MTKDLAVRPMKADEAHLIPQYFLSLGDEALRGMGVEPAKLPTHEAWLEILEEDFARPIQERHFFYLFWLVDGHVAGHSNINKIKFGDHAFAHLHLWNATDRRQDYGTQLFQLSLAEFFDRFQLKAIFCEPFAGNPAPNRTLPKAGFQLVKTYDTLPGWINFHQTVHRWKLERR